VNAAMEVLRLMAMAGLVGTAVLRATGQVTGGVD